MPSKSERGLWGTQKSGGRYGSSGLHPRASEGSGVGRRACRGVAVSARPAPISEAFGTTCFHAPLWGQLQFLRCRGGIWEREKPSILVGPGLAWFYHWEVLGSHSLKANQDRLGARVSPLGRQAAALLPGAGRSPVRAVSSRAGPKPWGSAGERAPAESASVCTTAPCAAPPTAHWAAAPR